MDKSALFQVGDSFAHSARPGIVWTVTRIRGRWPPHDIDVRNGNDGTVETVFELDLEATGTITKIPTTS